MASDDRKRRVTALASRVAFVAAFLSFGGVLLFALYLNSQRPRAMDPAHGYVAYEKIFGPAVYVAEWERKALRDGMIGFGVFAVIGAFCMQHTRKG